MHRSGHYLRHWRQPVSDPLNIPIDSSAPIGIFDSGVGGLSVLRALRQQLPAENVIYLGDQGHVPYGTRSLEEVRAFSLEVTRFLLHQGAKIIVVACNTASAAALHVLRQTFPDVPFVGMEPAVKPAAEHTHTGRVGVLATQATFQGELYASVVERFAQDVEIMTYTCPGLVDRIEKGDLDSAVVRGILDEGLNPMLKAGIDTVVLGCTHYPFVIPAIQQITGPDVRVIDPAPAVARRTAAVLAERGWLHPEGCAGKVRFLTTGAAGDMENLLPVLLKERGKVNTLTWVDGKLTEHNEGDHR